MLTWNFVLQLALITAAFGLALKIAGYFPGKIANWVKARTDDDDPWLRRLGRTADTLLVPTIWVILQWLLNLLMAGFGQPQDLMRITASLLNAWIVVHLVSSIVVNPFWRKMLAIFAWSVAAFSVLNILTPAIAYLDSVRFTMGRADLSLYKIVQAALLSAALLWLAFGLSRLIRNRIHKIDDLTPSVQLLLSKIARIGLILSAVLISLNVVGIDLTAFAVFSGALGIGLGFGLQKVVSNFISGIILLLDRSIQPNNVIEVGGTYGKVKSLGARYTSVVTRDGTEYLIPNENLITQEVINWSFSDTNIRLKTDIGVSYDTDIELARTLIMESARETDRVLHKPEVKCHLPR